MVAPTVRIIETPTLGNRSYVVHDGVVALAIDPPRDIDRIVETLEADGVELVAVFETHIHNDYVTGGLALADRFSATYHVHAQDSVAFDRRPIVGGDSVDVGDRLQVTAVATPGHTFHHLSYRIDDRADDRVIGIFTGGSLLYGATGRPDLLGPEHTDELVAHQYESAQRLAELVPADTPVFPTHGFGSFCAAGASAAPSDGSTVAEEVASNPVFDHDRDRWIDAVLDGLGEYPAYYAHVGPRNLAGPDAPDLSPPESADREEIRRRLAGGEWVVDLRHRSAFAAAHRPGTVNFGIDGSLATYVGWLIPWGTPITLVAERPEDIAAAQRELVRIGIDRPAAAATGDPADWSDGPTASFPTATFADLAEVRSHRPVAVLDVRRRDETVAGAIDGASTIPLSELLERMDELPDAEIWVHCAGGYRASIGASMVAAAGHRVVAVDDAFDAAVDAGLPLTVER